MTANARIRDNKKDKLSAGPSTTDSLGTSTSSNLTIESAGSLDNPHEMLPDSNPNTKNKYNVP
ncbi:hypothetical protein CPJCM30710_20240 [Clostridium polyendosporum]|uniref:Uncharacterized protein n=1 Tax=Clostridium polyendosporum TaxID=69208 RepID=A0A919VM95_9CLOT|nr:hypothetical protein [Clostridium polyendosporum]GIM29358.1 hypothetical protein CPJCM30710_20240 [Clostridium polyendosporum]